MKKRLFTISLLLVTALNSFSQTKSKNMNTIVLVHGARVDASCWDKVVPALKAAVMKYWSLACPATEQIIQHSVAFHYKVMLTQLNASLEKELMSHW